MSQKAYAIKKGGKWRVLDAAGKPIKRDGKMIDGGDAKNKPQAEFIANRHNLGRL